MDRHTNKIEAFYYSSSKEYITKALSISLCADDILVEGLDDECVRARGFERY